MLRDPGWWIVALAGFLLRGGFVVALAPILVLPTIAGIADVLAPVLIGFVFAGPSVAFIQLVAVTVLVVVGWLLLTTAVGAWLDVGLANEVATAVEVPGAPTVRRVATLHGVVVRLVAHIPTAIVLAWAAVTIGDAAYQELIAPGSPTLPVPIRVILRVPDAVAILSVAWLLGEAIGGLALRRLGAGESVGRSIVAGVGTFFRPAGLATFLVTSVLVVVAAVPVLVVPAAAFERVRFLLTGGIGGLELVVALAALIVSWLAALTVVSVALAFRQVAWTLEALRPLRAGEPVKAHTTARDGGPSGQ